MTEIFPFHPQQYQLDEHAMCSVALAMASMGPNFQIMRMGCDEQGFFIDGAQHTPIDDLWLVELARQALKIWHMNWPEPETMMGNNLRDFWRYSGQKIRARETIEPVVEVVCIGGQRELRPEHWPFKRPHIEAIGWSKPKRLDQGLKGHREVLWRLEGRALVDRGALRFHNRHERGSSPLENVKSNPLTKNELATLWRIERHWQDCLLDTEPDSIALYSSHEMDISSLQSNGWWWGVERKRDLLRSKRLWNESHQKGVDYCFAGSWDQIALHVSSSLHRIRKVVNILGLEVKHHLLAPCDFELSLVVPIIETNWGEASYSRDDSCSEARWTLWGYDSQGVWWPLSNFTLSQDRAGTWKVKGQAVMSFERLLALCMQ